MGARVSYKASLSLRTEGDICGEIMTIVEGYKRGSLGFYKSQANIWVVVHLASGMTIHLADADTLTEVVQNVDVLLDMATPDMDSVDWGLHSPALIARNGGFNTLDEMVSMMHHALTTLKMKRTAA